MDIATNIAAELALSALHPLLRKLSSSFGGDVTDEEMQHLTNFVRYEIVALTREAKSDDLVESLPLLEKLQAAALELDDLLDLCEYKQIEKQVSSASSNHMKKFIFNSKEKLRPILPKSSLRIGLEKLLKFVEQVEKIHPFITSRKGTAQTQAQARVHTVTPTTSALLSPNFGRKYQCDSLIVLLMDEFTAYCTLTDKVPVLAIIGMGGSGKTHTAQRICNDARVKNRFSAIMWVHVTRDFDVVELTRKMVESATNDECAQITNLDVLQKKLIESLSNKERFLLVLDDVWCDDQMKWDLLVGPLNEAAQSGSKIIVTTRMENIAIKLDAIRFHLEDLKVEECWSILKHYAFNNHEKIIDDQELIDVGNQIISKTRHSPLAIRIVGSSLRNKRSLNEWEKILKKDVLKETMDLLLFSYQCLPSHLQPCFAYCSLFPKGYEFNYDVNEGRSNLVVFWIAQGFIEDTNGWTLEEVAMEYVHELLSYSFFEIRSNDSLIVHDLLHDLAEKVSKRQCHRIEDRDSFCVPTTCVHLSLNITEKLVNSVNFNIVAIPDIFKMRNLRTLIILQDGGFTSIFESKKDMLQNLTKLRILHVEYSQQTELLSDPCIDKLKHLRYLNVRYYSKVPASVAKLYQLQYFVLITDQLEYLAPDTLPQGLSDLINLRELRFYGKNRLELDYLYGNSGKISIEKLVWLQHLKIFHPDGLNRMITLKNLSLCGELSIRSLENIKCKEEAQEAMLNEKKNLIELDLRWTAGLGSIDTCEEVLEGLEPHRNLENLSICEYQGVKLPNWMVKENPLPRLKVLELRSCTSLKVVRCLPPRLGALYVSGCDELMQLPPLSETVVSLCLIDCPKLTPPSLADNNFVNLCLSGLPNLHTLANLRHTVMRLVIEDCPNLTYLGNMNRNTSLKYLQICKCPMLVVEEVEEEGVMLELVFHPGSDEPSYSLVQYSLKAVWTDVPWLVFQLVSSLAICSITHLRLKDCAVLPNVEMLASLQQLYIHDCPDVELLPNLPETLQLLGINGSQKLAEMYKDGGPLCDILSDIPHVHFDYMFFEELFIFGENIVCPRNLLSYHPKKLAPRV